MRRRPPRSTLFPYTPLFGSIRKKVFPERRAQRTEPDVRAGKPIPAGTSGSEKIWRVSISARKVDRLQAAAVRRSEEHTSELQSRQYLVCRLLLEKKKTRYLR